MSKLVNAGQGLLLAIPDNAPFYPAPIREAANDTHGAAKDLIDMHLAALTHFAKGLDVTKGEQFIAERETTLRSVVEGVDLVETLIRNRLAAVEVVNGAVV